MTLTGLIIIPLGLLIILLPWRYSLITLPVLATLDNAAVVNVDAFGLQPGFFFGILIIARTLIEILLLDTRINPHVLRMLAPLLLFAIISFTSIWVGLTFFQGRVMVISSTAGFDLDLAQPYTFQRQNLTQPFYLILNIGIVYAFAHQVARLPSRQILVTLDRAVITAILFSSLIVIWEAASFYYGVPFLSDFFHSNAGYSQLAHGQILFGQILRLSGSFSEPSALAYHFAAFLMYAWYRYLGTGSTGAMSMVLLCFTVMVASTSTTAFAMLGIFALIVGKDLLVKLTTEATRIKLSVHHVGAAALLGIASLGVLVFIQSHWYYIDGVLTSMVLEKSHSGSFAERIGADLMALDIVMQTGGIGLGLGSHKPNNLAMTVLSNTGIAGTLVFGIFLFALLRPRRGRSSDVDLRRFRWMVLGLLSVHLISNPNLNPLILWVSFALVVGALCAQSERSTPRRLANVSLQVAQPACR
jgi:hypothetical protein